MSNVFISYSHADGDFASRLVMHLRVLNFDVWIDSDRIDVGRDWPRMLEQTIIDSDAVVVVVSNAAHQSEWVKQETELALKSKKPIFPLLLEGNTTLPAIRHLHHYDVRDRDFGRSQLGMPLREFYEDLHRAVPYEHHIDRNLAEATERIVKYLSRIKTIGWISVEDLSSWSGISIHYQEGDRVIGMASVHEDQMEDLYNNLDYIESIGWTIDDINPDHPWLNFERNLKNRADETQLAREIITVHQRVFLSRPASLTIEWNTPD